ncbi:hypothetical protein B0T22DRAFT_460644 [Podospora appendiculata]|uniref:Uncharacterized protein n=1 Tax=Podospora appendiculata TaxID=314037 RepID=A0AAE0XAN7_9PEZI|nr:hypothetical protein B0T22DRAFT_460644 [Podospora appendiculata]
MTQLRAFTMTDSRQTFVEGASALRNLRDLAQRHRDSAIQTANAKARERPDGEPIVEQEVAEVDHYEDSGSGHFVESGEDIGPGIADMSGDYYYAASPSQEPVDEPSAMPQYSNSTEYQEYGYVLSQSLSAAGPAGMSLATDLTPTSNDSSQTQARPKPSSAARSPRRPRSRARRNFPAGAGPVTANLDDHRQQGPPRHWRQSRNKTTGRGAMRNRCGIT